MYKYLLLISLPPVFAFSFVGLPLIGSEASNNALSTSDIPVVPTRPVPIRAVAIPRLDFEGRAAHDTPIGTPPSSPKPARILRGKRSLMGFSRALPVEILAPGMLISFDSTTAVYKRGNRIEIRIHDSINIDEDHSDDATE